MRRRVRVVVDWAVGLTLIGVGIVGGFVPVLQGWVFILAGLAILSSHSPLARRLYERAKATGRRIRERVRERRAARRDGAADDEDQSG